MPKNLGVDTFPDPVGHFGAHWWPFWILQAVRRCRRWASAPGAARLVFYLILFGPYQGLEWKRFSDILPIGIPVLVLFHHINITFQLDCSPAPTCHLVKQNSNPTWGSNFFYWFYKFGVGDLVGDLGVPIFDYTNNAISLMLLGRIQSKFESWLVRPFVLIATCHWDVRPGNICPCNICPSFIKMAYIS